MSMKLKSGEEKIAQVSNEDLIRKLGQDTSPKIKQKIRAELRKRGRAQE